MSIIPRQPVPVRVLLVEDDPPIADSIRRGLEPGRFCLHHARTVAESRRMLQAREYDAVVLDLALPDGSGFEIADGLRASGASAAILMLTAKGSVNERVDGFRHGADDYLCKPFAVEELVARLRAVLRRSRQKCPHVLKYADVELDLVKRTLRRQNTEESLSARETDLLAYFMSRPEEVVARERILEDVWGNEAEDDSNVVNVYVNYLRNKLERSEYSRLIHTVRGVGYVLSKDEPRGIGS